MQIDYSKHFIKSFKKSPSKIKFAFRSRLALFVINPYAVILNNHALKGKWFGYRSINVTGDWRAIFTTDDDYSLIRFYAINTHSQLYG